MLAIAIGVAVVGGESFLYSSLTGQAWKLFSELDWWHVAIAATPFVVLALLAVRRLAPWVVALALTLSLWGWWLYSTVHYFWHADGSGADIGTDMMLLASPFVISVIAAAVHFALQDARART
jgi:hypothetical protein